jgi:hypothetical protein
MNMLDSRIAELVQADVDGELSVEHRAELNAALESSSEARQFHDEMSRVAGLLTDASDLDPPWGLRRRILDNVNLPAKPWLSGWQAPASYGLAMAAGVLMAVGVSQVTPRGSEDMSSLVGTMVSQGHDISTPATSSLAIDLAEVQGQVHLKQISQAWAVEFDLQSTDAVEVSVDLDGTGLSFGGYAGQDENAGTRNFQVHGEKVRVTNQGSHQFVLFLRSAPESSNGSQEIGVAINHRGNMVDRGLLESARG